MFRQGKGFTAKDMLSAGWEAKDMRAVGVPVEVLHSAGYSPRAMFLAWDQ